MYLGIPAVSSNKEGSFWSKGSSAGRKEIQSKKYDEVT